MTDKPRMEQELLFKYFNNKTTSEEEAAIAAWLEENEENVRIYNDASDLFELYLQEACENGLLDGYPALEARRKRRERIVRLIKTGIAAAAAIALVCIFSFRIAGNRYEKMLADTMNTIVVPDGKSMDFILPDSTVINLNSGARLSYPMAFARDRREVFLEGEAFFNVRHDNDRPFTVKTFAYDVTVLGTKFNVNADRQSGAFSAALVEGSVRVSGASGEQIMMKPQDVVILKDGRLRREPALTASETVFWKDGIFDACGLDFETLMKKMERAYGVKIYIELDKCPELNYTSGRFYISDGIDHALKVLQYMVDFRFYRDQESGAIHIKPLE